jgi:hypothetical protein
VCYFNTLQHPFVRQWSCANDLSGNLRALDHDRHNGLEQVSNGYGPGANHDFKSAHFRVREVGMVKNRNMDHPADALATALDQASGLIGAMGDLYNPGSESFSGGNTFVVHALSTASTLIAEARAALDDLHYSCDLTMLEQPQSRNEVMELATSGNHVAKEQPQNPVEAEEPAQAAVEFAVAQPPAAVQQEYAAPVDEEPFAQSYLELLRKLTAAEVFAAEQQALSVPGTSPELLPLLRSLREDLQKIHSAA